MPPYLIVIQDAQPGEIGIEVIVHHRVFHQGEIGDGTTVEKSFRLSELPPESLTFGLEVTGGEGFRLQRLPDIGRMRLRLTNADGNMVILEDGPLKNWVWSLSPKPDWTFIYKRGEIKETVLENGKRQRERINIKSDSGSGTTFIARPEQSYKLDVSASFNEDAIKTYHIRLLARGGGGVPPF